MIGLKIGSKYFSFTNILNLAFFGICLLYVISPNLGGTETLLSLSLQGRYHAMYLKSKDWKNYIRVRRLSLPKMCDWLIDVYVRHNLMLAPMVRKVRVSTFVLLFEMEMYREQMWLLLNNGISCEDSRESVAKMSNCWWVNGYEIIVMM